MSRCLASARVCVADEDTERFLLKLKERVGRVGIDMPTATIEVRFQNVDAEAEEQQRLPTVFKTSTQTSTRTRHEDSILKSLADWKQRRRDWSKQGSIVETREDDGSRSLTTDETKCQKMMLEISLRELAHNSTMEDAVSEM